MTDPDDVFSRHDAADPVTADDTDSVQSSVEQTEADNLRSSAQTNSDASSTRNSVHSSLSPSYVARCRFCRSKFRDTDVAVAHEGECKAEPKAQCRYCKQTHTGSEKPENHLESCAAYKREKERQREQNQTEQNAEDPDGEHFSRLFVDPQPHEFHGYLKWDCSDLGSPLRSYFGLRSLQSEHDFEDHGRLRGSIEIDDDEWTIEFGFKDSGIAPRDDPDFRLEEVREYLIYVYPSAYSSWGDAKSEARKRAYFRLSPRWPGIETKEGLNPMSNPCGIEGYDVEVEGSNWDFEKYPEILQRALQTLSDRQGFRFNSPTPIRPVDFNSTRIHQSSNIVDAEMYVRVENGETGQAIAYDGSIHRISLLLAGDREGYAKSVRDDRECPGYYHTATIDSRRAGELIGNHELAKEFKHYHMRNPDAVEGNVLENPKIGVSFQNSIHDGTLYWDDLDTLVTELDEALLNVLEWSDISTDPSSQVFVADDYFESSGSRRWRKLLPDRLPRIESKQDDKIFSTATQMNETDAELLDTLLTDGGETSPKELAERIGVHIDTVYRALKRLSPIVDNTYGDVQLGSKYIAQELTGYIDALSESMQSGLENALDGLTRAEAYGDGTDPWSRWLDRYGGKIKRTDDADPDELDIGYKPSDLRDARRLLREGALQWKKVTGRPLRQFAFEFAPAVTTADGERYAPERFADALGTPG